MPHTLQVLEGSEGSKIYTEIEVPDEKLEAVTSCLPYFSEVVRMALKAEGVACEAKAINASVITHSLAPKVAEEASDSRLKLVARGISTSLFRKKV